MSSDALFDRERIALRKLQQVVRDRAAGEKTFSDTFQTTTDEADKEAQKARKTIAAARKKSDEDLDQAHQANLDSITTKYDSAQENADTKRVDFRKKTVDHFSEALERARSKYQDKLWTVASVLEAGEKEAQDRFDELKRKSDAAKVRVAKFWDRAEVVLARVGMDRDDVSSPEDELPREDPILLVKHIESKLGDAEEAAVRLEGIKLTNFLGLAGTFGAVMLMAALGGVVGFLAVKGFAIVGVAMGFAIVGGLGLRLLLGMLASRQARDRGTALGVILADVSRSARSLLEQAEEAHRREREEVQARHDHDKKAAGEYYLPKIESMEKQLEETLAKLEDEYVKSTDKIRTNRAADTKAEIDRYTRESDAANARFDAELAAAEERLKQKTAAAIATRDTAFQKVEAAWKTGLAEVAWVGNQLIEYGHGRFPKWDEILRSDRPLPTDAPLGIRFGEFDVDLYAMPDGMPYDARLNPAEPLHTQIPAFLPFPQKCSILFKAQNEGRPAAVATLQATMLRFLTGLPPGKVRFTIIDPVGLGENFAAFMHLADFDEKLVTARIWTEPGHIEKRLADLTEHMENVIQKYLRNQYKSIEEYNSAAGEVAEPYRVLVIANFPQNFTTDAARRLVSILSSGPACGVCTLVSMDTNAAMPRDFNPADLEQVAYTLNWGAGKFRPVEADLAPFPLAAETPPDPATIAKLVKKVGEASRDASRVEVPFEFIMPTRDQWWNSSAAKGFEVAIGRAGATRRQLFQVGRGTAQHALVAGKTGSGKSTLLHALITNLALTYSPDEAELFLIDFKKGVEFKMYADQRLPHARVIAIESEREFGLSVLQRLDGVLRERGDEFRRAGVNDLGGYREAKPDVRCPRILLVVDEFQEFFVEDDKLGQEAALLLDRLVRQGRAFGVHVLLGSQTLGGAFSLARSTIDQMAVRIALQCSDADAQLILSKDNNAARLLNRPGEAIYNDANGLVEGNDPFQVVWLAEEKREQLLGELRDRADGKFPPPLVFEGSAAADLSSFAPISTLVSTPAAAIPEGPPMVWLGDPVAIKDPTVAVFRPQSGANLLLIGQHEEAALGLLTASITALVAKLRPSAEAKPRPITVVDGTPDDGDFADYLRNATAALGLPGAVVDRSELPTAMAELAAEFERRQKGESTDRTPRFLLVNGLQRVRELRKADDDFGFGRRGDKTVTPGEHFLNILRDGPGFGIHCIVWCDTLNNLQRAVDRQGIREFALRVLFQMSASDSSHLLDSPVASRLGRTRALYIEEGSERPEKFRPFGVASGSWLRHVGDQLHPPTSPTGDGSGSNVGDTSELPGGMRL